MNIQKQYVSLNISEYEHKLSDPFYYKSLYEVGIDQFIQVFKEAMQDSLSRDDQAITDIRAELQNLVKMAGNAFNPRCWFVATLNGEYIGLAMPQRYSSTSMLGSVFYIGVLPKFRGHGYGQILHSKALSILCELGATEYVGSVDVLNTPMVKVFEKNGCMQISARAEKISS